MGRGLSDIRSGRLGRAESCSKWRKTGLGRVIIETMCLYVLSDLLTSYRQLELLKLMLTYQLEICSKII